MYKLNTCI